MKYLFFLCVSIIPFFNLISAHNLNENSAQMGAEQQGITASNAAMSTVVIDPNQSVARNWMELLLESIRNDFARPTVHARNLFHSSVIMYDVWAAYQSDADRYFLGKSVDGYVSNFLGVSGLGTIQSKREEAISFAMYRLLKHRFANSPAAATMFPQYDQYMSDLGYDINDVSMNYQFGTPAALGNYIADHMITFGLQDGSNEQNDYVNTFYQPANNSLVMEYSGNPNLTDFNRWQPLTFDFFVDQSGNIIPTDTPEFLSPEWGAVSPFSFSENDLTTYERNGDDYMVYCDPGPPPYIDINTGGGTSDAYKWGFSLVSSWSSHLDVNDNAVLDISPASIGNIQSYPDTQAEMEAFYDFENGGDASIGHAINPVTGLPYVPQTVKRADYARVLAEFWADGPDSETPPGHWFTILNYVNDHPDFEKKYEGIGPILDDLEWDVKAYFTLGGAMHDAAIAAWGAKGWYDYIRPISAIRGMAELGQSSDFNLPSYHVGGLPLVPGRIELVAAGDPLAGTVNQHVDKIKLLAWKGPDYLGGSSLEAGVDWILAEDWWPYQRPTFVTPNFAGYVSGHSTYSRTAAEVMTGLTGSPYFPGGMGEFEAPQDNFLVFEQGPSQDLTLQWATYRDASDQCSLSRIWGGIHPPADDMPGRFMGMKIGVDAYNFAKSYISPNSCSVDIPLIVGWNMISSPCRPESGAMEDVFDPIVNNIIQVKDLTGGTYIPAFNGFNTMNEWDVRSGYLVKTSEADTLTITGGHPVNLIIDNVKLNQGWNLIAYWLQQDTDPQIVFDPIVNDVIQVKNLSGSYVPSFNNFNNMGDMSETKGYLVKMNAGSILRYE